MQKLTMEDIQLMNLLEQLTGARANDVITESDVIIFAVPDSEFGRAIGKQGSNIQRLGRTLNRQVEIVKSPKTKEQFFGGLFHPATVKEYVEKIEDGKKALEVLVDNENRGLAIGRNGEKIKRAKMLGKRYFDYVDVRIVTRISR